MVRSSCGSLFEVVAYSKKRALNIIHFYNNNNNNDDELCIYCVRMMSWCVTGVLYFPNIILYCESSRKKD